MSRAEDHPLRVWHHAIRALAIWRPASIIGPLVLRADAARDARRYREAALLYADILALDPSLAAIHIQCGHMFKEAGDLASAERHYRVAEHLLPDDADLALQMGHFLKVAGRMQEAAIAYREALRLKPGWSKPGAELLALEQSGPAAAQLPR